MHRVAMIAYTHYLSDPRVRREAEALAARGDEVEFFCLRRAGEPSRQELAGVKIRRLPVDRYRGGSSALYIASYFQFFFAALFAVSIAHLRRPFDLVHSNNMPDFMAYTGLLPRLAGRPLIHDIHDTMPEIYQGKFGVDSQHPLIRMLKLQERMAGRLASKVLTSEHTKRDALIEHGLPASKIEVLLNLPDPAIFPLVSASENAARADGYFRLVFHGTLAERLGVDIAMRAVAKLGDRIPNLRLDVIGDGDHRPALIALRDQLDLGERVRFSDGFVPVESLPELLSGAQLAVVPTRVEISTRYMLATKLVEYAMLGIPAIVAPTHTIRYYFEDDQVAYFAPEDPEALAEMIIELHDDPARRLSLAERAADFFDEYHWDRHKLVYTELVDRLCAGDKE